jgi:hypothetical protein
MAVREFNGTSDRIILDPGDLSVWTGAGMSAALVKRAASSEMTPYSVHTSTTEFYGPDYEAGVTDILTDTGFSTVGSAIPVNVWVLVIFTKASGSATPRLHTYNYNTDTWAHANLGTALADSGPAGADGEIHLGDWDSSLWFSGLEAAVGFWSDTPDDATIEAAGLETALQSWLDFGTPLAVWGLDQASTATAVEDLTGGADQTSISGTTVEAADDPPGFDFTVSSGGTTITGTASAVLGLTATATGVRRVIGSATASLGVSATVSGVRTVRGTASAALGLTATARGTNGEESFASFRFGPPRGKWRTERPRGKWRTGTPR